MDTTNLFLVVSVTEKRFFAFSTDEVFHVPVLAQSSHYPLLNRPMTRAADRNTHLVVTAKTIKLFLDSSRIRVKFDAAVLAIEVIWMIRLSLEKNKHCRLADQGIGLPCIWEEFPRRWWSGTCSRYICRWRRPSLWHYIRGRGRDLSVIVVRKSS